MTSPFPPALDGAVIPGGCDDCNAEQRLRQDQPGMWSVGIHHDDTCPTWQRIRARRNGTIPDTFRA
ncbi:hypothetical protein [Streptomyces sp. NPDC003730]